MLLQWYFWKQSYFRLLSPHFPAICQKIPFFGPFWPLFIICACLLAISLLHLCLYWKKVFTGCCCNDICKEKATSGYLHPIFLPFARKFHFFLFLAILHHLCLLEGNPFIPLPLLLTKLLSLGAVAMISANRKLLQAITTPFSHHSPDISIFGHFWPFLAIFHHLSPLMGNPLTPTPLLLT